MAIPDFQSIMLPLLQRCADGQEHSTKEVVEQLAEAFGLTEAETRELLPSGRQGRFANRVHWAKGYLKSAGLLSDTRRAHFEITARGREVLAQAPAKITIKFLEQFPEFKSLREARSSKTVGVDTHVERDATPEELLEGAYQRIRADLEAELLQKVKACSPAFFERLVVQLLVRMGYGGTLQDAGRAIGRSGDGGIDGIIKEDRLGLDIIYIQAKRWENTVGSARVREFAGARRCRQNARRLLAR